MLLQVQALQVRAQDGQHQEGALGEAESNIHLAGRKFTKEASWPKTETGLSLQTTGGRPPDRSTKVGKPELLLFGMDPITADVGKVDLGPVVILYDNKVVGKQIRRPQGQVDQENNSKTILELRATSFRTSNPRSPRASSTPSCYLPEPHPQDFDPRRPRAASTHTGYER